MKSLQKSGNSIGRVLAIHYICFCAIAVAQTAPDVVWESEAPNTGGWNRVAISPDGEIVATLGTNYTVQLWRTSDGTPLRTLPELTSWVNDMVWSPDGLYLAAGNNTWSVHVWRTVDWSLAYSVETVNQAPPVAFSPDSATLAIGNGTAIELLRTTNGTVFQSWTASNAHLISLAFSPDGTRLGSGAGSRGYDNSLKIWEVQTGSLLRSIPTAQTYNVGRVLFSPDGTQVLTGSEFLYSGPLQSWRVSDAVLLRTFPESAYDMAFSADGNMLVAVGTDISFFRMADGDLVQKYDDGYASHPLRPKGIAFTPDGRLFVRSSGFGGVFAAHVPVLLSAPTLENGQMVVRWGGGSERYQLQRSLVLPGAWQDQGGVITTNTATVPIDAPGAYYRVVALPR